MIGYDILVNTRVNSKPLCLSLSSLYKSMYVNLGIKKTTTKTHTKQGKKVTQLELVLFRNVMVEYFIYVNVLPHLDYPFQYFFLFHFSHFRKISLHLTEPSCIHNGLKQP